MSKADLKIPAVTVRFNAHERGEIYEKDTRAPALHIERGEAGTVVTVIGADWGCSVTDLHWALHVFQDSGRAELTIEIP